MTNLESDNNMTGHKQTQNKTTYNNPKIGVFTTM